MFGVTPVLLALYIWSLVNVNTWRTNDGSTGGFAAAIRTHKCRDEKSNRILKAGDTIFPLSLRLAFASFLWYFYR